MLNLITKICLVSPIALMMGFFPQNIQAKDLEIQVGIVQRFGDEMEDELMIKSTQGNSLNLNFLDPNTQKPLSLKTQEITLKIQPESLTNPSLQERLILGDHATFETAENDAKKWEKLGIQVEITQPGRWQVWAKRDVYKTPLLKRFLLNSLKKKGYAQPYIQTAILSEKPEVSFEINKVLYQVQSLKITTNNNLIKVQEGENNPLRLYSGNLNIQPNAYGDYTLVNNVLLESYLRGVVPYEIGPNAPRNAVEAQSIIARTYALRNTRRFLADDYQLCASTHCQVYYGLMGVNPISDKAIASTRGLVLTYNNELVDALYSSTSGGVTANFSDNWNGEERPYLKSRLDSPSQLWDLSKNSLSSEANFKRFISLKKGFNETGTPVFRWNRKSDLEDLTEDLQKYLEKTKHPLAKFTTIKQMDIVKRSPSGRILKFKIETDLGIVILEKTEVRSAFGPPRSTFFYIEPIFDQNEKLKLKGYAFIGGGFGHGVGLSQFGSYNLAKLGWSAKKILEFYYPNTKIEPLNDSIVFW